MLLSFLGSYYAAVIENQVDFAGRVVVDVGAGSGILSLFAAQVLLMNTYRGCLDLHFGILCLLGLEIAISSV